MPPAASRSEVPGEEHPDMARPRYLSLAGLFRGGGVLMLRRVSVYRYDEMIAGNRGT